MLHIPFDSKLTEIIRCPHCNNMLSLKSERKLNCYNCLCSLPLNNNVLCVPELEAIEDADSDYELRTKHRYQTDGYAENYYKLYKNIYNIYPYFIAKRETQGVFKLIDSISNEIKILLDIPAGTGKLAEMHNIFDYSLVAGDVSSNMLKKGIEEWGKCRNLLGLTQTDITKTLFVDDAFDCLVCLRLMHRLPKNVIVEALNEISRITKKYLVVSNGLQGNLSAYIRPKKISKSETSLDKNSWYSMLSKIGTVEDEFYIARGISKGVITLVKLKK